MCSRMLLRSLVFRVRKFTLDAFRKMSGPKFPSSLIPLSVELFSDPLFFFTDVANSVYIKFELC